MGFAGKLTHKKKFVLNVTPERHYSGRNRVGLAVAHTEKKLPYETMSNVNRVTAPL